MKILIMYIPVLHSGYEKFLFRHTDVDEVLIFGDSIIASFEWLKKDLRCLTPLRALQAVQSWGFYPRVKFLDDVSLGHLREAEEVIMPDETECRHYAESYLSGVKVNFDPVKLRYDKKRTESVSEISAIEVSSDEATKLMNIVLTQAENSMDWWIQVGGIIVREGRVILAGYNTHRPNEREALFEGDPRSNYRRGINIELSVADHAEVVLIGEAARRGIPTEGADLYIKTFPCPPCSGLVGRSRFGRLFFRDGYAMIDGDKSLRGAGIELFRVVN